MRFILVALLAALCACLVSTAQFDTSNYSQKQKDVWKLFKHIHQPSYFKEHVQIAQSWDFYENINYYTKPEVVHEFYEYWHYEVLPEKGEIFSVFHHDHLKYAIALFKMFYYAKDWDTFYKTAVWARNYINEGIFLYSFSVALIHRPDTYYFTLPPIYEIYPWYFYSSEVIHEAEMYKQLYNGGQGGQYNGKTIYSNYSGWYLNLHPEQSLSYFTEDVEMNAFYYYYNLYYPFWMSGDEFGLKYDNRGELFYYMYQQILSRYYLERLSNGFGEIEWFDWWSPFTYGYHPSLCYPNGLEFPTRPSYVHLYDYFYNYGQKWNFNSKYGYSFTYVTEYEKRIFDAIDYGYAFTKSGEKVDLWSPEGFNYLGNLIEANPDSPYYKYYGSFQFFARHLLGYSYQPYDHHTLYPSALEHFETSLRDPAFYMLYKKVLMYFMHYKYQMPHYKESDLIFKGVHVSKVEFDRLITYFDYFYSDISNAVYVTPDEYVKDDFHVQVAQPSLTHKPFTYKIYVDSDKDVDAVVYVYLGPKYDEYDRYINLTHNWMNFVQFDHFPYKLKSGQNVISRNSKEMFNYFHDRSTYYELYQKAFGAYDKSFGFQFFEEQIWFGFPHKFYLPKGDYYGYPFQFFVYVAPTYPYKTHMTEPYVGSGMQYVDGYPFGYPFDRPVYYEKMFYELPNTYFHEVKIYHRDDARDINVSTVSF